jgi:uroporphyrinogen-III synthase
MHILITRPQENAKILSLKLQQLGHVITIDSLIHVIPLAATSLNLPPFSSCEAIVTTSQQSIRCLSRLTSERHFPLWCVGPDSAEVAKNLGFQVIHTADGSAEDLITKLMKSLSGTSHKPILHLSGDFIRFDVVQTLQDQGLNAKRLIVYKTQEAEALLPETQQALKARTMDAVLFYSPRTAKTFKNLCRLANLEAYCASLLAICLSDAVKAEIQDIAWKNIRVAKKTTTDDLLMALIMAD